MTKQVFSVLLAAIILMFIISCDLLDDDEDEAGASSTGAGEVATPAEQDTEPASTPEPEPEPPPASKVRLNAFSDFSCTSNWTNRDGALGLKAHEGDGTCTASFTGVSASYKVQLKVQAERDGAPPYTLSIGGSTVASGNYPYATGRLACDCSYTQCPDTNKYITLGTFQVDKGDDIKFWADQVYPCGHDHGAYAKWHEMIFTPVD